MSQVPKLKLNDGVSIPQLGFGLWQIGDSETQIAVAHALEAGYRLFDGAAIYRNEAGFGRELNRTQVQRNELFITTKLWNSDQGYDSTLRAFDESLKKLGIEELDLYLIHWPAPKQKLFVDSWKAMIEIKNSGRVKSIGVSNFAIEHLNRLIDETGAIPSVNQVELHPRFQQKALREFHAKYGIATESWSPLGQGHVLGDPKIAALAAKYKKTPAQIVIKWHLQSGLIVIPKSVTPSRIKENIDVFGFTLDAVDMAVIASIDTPTGRVGPDPVTADF